MTDRVQSLLAEAAQGRLATLPPTTDPVSRVTRAVERDRRRRQGLAATTAAFTVVLALVLAVSVVPRLTADPVPPSLPQLELPKVVNQTFPEVRDTVDIDGVAWPVAGRRTADVAFVHQLEQVSGPRPTGLKCESFPPRVLFADDVGGTTVVIARSPSGCWWMAEGVPGKDVGPLSPLATAGDEESPLGVLIPAQGGAVDLVVLAPVGRRVELAPAPQLWPAADRPFAPLEGSEGITIATLKTDGQLLVTSATTAIRTVAEAASTQGVVVSLLPGDLGWVAGEHLTNDQADSLNAFVLAVPEELRVYARRAALTAIWQAGFGPAALSFTLVDSAPGPAVVVDVVQGSLRSRAMNSGHLDSSAQSLVSQSDQVDTRRVTAHKGAAGCLGWTPFRSFFVVDPVQTTMRERGAACSVEEPMLMEAWSYRSE